MGGEVYDSEGLAPTICVNKSSSYTIVEPQAQKRTIAFKEMPNGNIRAYDPLTPDKRGISEMQITDPENLSPTITTAQTPQIMKKEQNYRIRKLTPRECFRLMDVDDKYIDKILDATDENGKPLVSKSQCYKLAGNSIVVSCLFHIFKNLFTDEVPENQQLTLF